MRVKGHLIVPLDPPRGVSSYGVKVLAATFLVAFCQGFDLLPVTSVAALWLLVLAVVAILSVRAGSIGKLGSALCAVLGIQLISLLWAVSVTAALQALLATTSALGVYLFVRRLRMRGHDVWPSVLALAPCAILLAAAVVLFRVSPTLEVAYLQGRAAPWFVGGGVRELFTGSGNNVLLPDRAGGLYVNGNTASMFLGVLTLTLLSAAIRLRSRVCYVAAATSLLGALATGSKTALILTGIVIGLGLLAWLHVQRYRALLPVGMLAVLASAGGVSLAAFGEGTWLDDARGTLGVRGRIWAIAQTGFQESPIVGLGYGGWENRYDRFASTVGGATRPAHNFIIQAWADGGLLLASAVLALTLGAVLAGYRRAQLHTCKREAASALCVVGAFVWIALHGMADNTFYYGDPRSLVLFAFLLAVTDPMPQRVRHREWDPKRRMQSCSY